MSRENKLIVIVQNKPTQFDAPFYAFIWKQGGTGLRIFYTTARSGSRVDIDPETGHAPQWNHLASEAGTNRIIWAEDRSAQSLAREIASLNPDLVIISGYFPLLHAQLALLLKLHGIKIGLRSDNTLRHSSFSGVKGLAKRILLPVLLRSYDTWHPVGTLARQYLEKIAAAKKTVFLFPYNVDNAWFGKMAARCRRDGDALRAEMGFTSGNFLVIGVMKWHDREDPLTLVDAFRILYQQHPSARLLLVGDGPLRDDVHARLAGLESVTHLPGYVPYSDLPKLYAVSDVFVHTAPGEPWGVSVNEAMACGLPVVAAEGVGAGVDLIEAGVTGFTFADRGVGELAAILSRMLSERALTARMGQQAATRVESWSYAQTAREMELAVNWVAGRATD